MNSLTPGATTQSALTPVPITSDMTPLMQQFWAIKNQHFDKVLLFRMGDFYEMFYDDAKIAAPILNIALTSRNKKAEEETPMCGVPHHSIATPISKLLAAGLKVAICDQLEDPETAKGIVKRGVTRILTPGMVYDPETLAELSANYVAAFDSRSVSFIEASTGECFYYSVSGLGEVIELLALMKPTEVVMTSEQELGGKSDPPSNAPSSLHSQEQLSYEALFELLQRMAVHRSTYNEIKNLAMNVGALGATSVGALSATSEVWPERFIDAPESAKRLLSYATAMQGATVINALKSFEPRSLQDTMALGENALRHLEVFQSYSGEDRGSLFAALNRTKTSAGARLLRSWLRLPLIKKDKIENRLNQVERWSKKPADLKILRQQLAQMGDIERRLAKIAYANVHVRDLVALMQSLRVGISISPLCNDIRAADLKTAVTLCESIERTLVDEPPMNVKSGGYIRTGVTTELDELIALSENGQKLLLELEAREKEATQISSLKVRYNNVFGYYIEVTNSHTAKVPDHYKRKQTLANAERYVTQELHELESKILSSRERRVQLEERLLHDLRNSVLQKGSLILSLAHKWSELDVLSSLAWLALEQNYSRPTLREDIELKLDRSRHPVVEQTVMQTFVPNTLILKGGECLLLTGPNMAGKSTLMRQVAVTALMAQMGSFVPAAKAELPIFERIFTRIGASDSLSEGLSTFMVEMRETSEMLKGAGPRTLVVLDEVGRGTSTYDGMSLAQAILEYLVKTAKSLTLFATHYHEITELAERYEQIHNAHMSVQEQGHDIRFLYTLKSGPANKSYGIQVARLAGLPASVVARAQELLAEHENDRAEASGKYVAQPSAAAQLLALKATMELGKTAAEDSLPLLDFANESLAEEADELRKAHAEQAELLAQLKAFNTLEASPLAALNKIAEWQQELS